MSDTKAKDDDPGTNQASAASGDADAGPELPRSYSRGATEAVHTPNPRSFANADEADRAQADREWADQRRDELQKTPAKGV